MEPLNTSEKKKRSIWKEREVKGNAGSRLSGARGAEVSLLPFDPSMRCTCCGVHWVAVIPILTGAIFSCLHLTSQHKQHHRFSRWFPTHTFQSIYHSTGELLRLHLHQTNHHDHREIMRTQHRYDRYPDKSRHDPNVWWSSSELPINNVADAVANRF